MPRRWRPRQARSVRRWSKVPRAGGQMLTLRQTSSVPPKDGVHRHGAFLALRTAATNPELVGPPAALLYALRTVFQITASAATGGGLLSAVATSACSFVMSPSRLDDPLPELTATLSAKTR